MNEKPDLVFYYEAHSLGWLTSWMLVVAVAVIVVGVMWWLRKR